MTDQSIAHAASVPTLISIYEERQKQLEEAQLQVATKQKLVTRSVEDIQTALAAGGTTGDPFRDEFIKLYGIEPALEKAYKDLNDSLAGHKGEFVLLAFTKTRVVLRGLFRSERFTDVTYYRLAVLEDDKLIPRQSQFLHKGELILELPVSCYLKGETAVLPESPNLDAVWQHGALFGYLFQGQDPPLFSTYMLEKSGLLPERRRLSDMDPHDVELLVGNKAVRQWLEEKGMQQLYRPAAHALGMFELEPTPG